MRLPARIATVLLAVLCAVVFTRSACAHATLLASDPPDGAMIAAAPPQLTLTFNEPVSALVIRLVGPDGRAQLLANPQGRQASLVLAAPASMPHGTHALSYRVVSLDSHPVGGTIVFSIGAASGAPPAPEDSHDSGVVAATLIAKVIIYLGLMVGIGGCVFVAWTDTRLRASRIRTVALLGGIAAIALAVGLQGADALGVPLAGLLSGVVWRTGFETTFGATALAATASLVVALAGEMACSRLAARATSLLALAGAGVALALSGHASAAAPQALMRPAVFVHAVAVALWIGALIPLGAALGRADGAAVLMRFSRFIPWAVGTLMITGVLLAIVQIERWSELLTTPYGTILCAKLVLVFLMLALAGWNRFRLTAAIRGGEKRAARTLFRTIVAEVVIATLILGLVSAWRFTPPPRALALAAARPAMLHIHTAQAMADVRFEPGHAGIVEASIVIMTGDFGGLDAKELTLTIEDRAAGLEAISRPAVKGADSVWRVERMPIPQNGRWSVSLDILMNDFEKISLQGTIDIGKEQGN